MPYLKVTSTKLVASATACRQQQDFIPARLQHRQASCIEEYRDLEIGESEATANTSSERPAKHSDRPHRRNVLVVFISLFETYFLDFYF